MNNQSNDIPEGFKMTELGLLPQEWQVVSLANMAKLQGGYAFKSKEYVTNGTPVVRISNVRDGWLDLEDCVYWKPDYSTEVKNYELTDGDILISMTGEIGRVAVVRRHQLPALLNQRVGRFRNINHQYLHPMHLYYYLQTVECRNNIISNAFGAIQANISANKILAIKIPLPPLPEQKAIAQVLSTIQKAIEAQDKIIAAARELKKSLMRHLFTYGSVPVTEAEQVPLKETEIGPVPEHWEVVKLESIVIDEKGAIKMGPFGSQLKKSELSSSGIRVYGQENLIKRDFALGNRFVKGAKFESLKTFEIKPLDVLVTMMGTVGHSAVFPENGNRGIIDSHLIRIRVKREEVEPIFLKTIFETDTVKQEIEAQGHGAIMKGLNTTIIKNLFIPLPSRAEQQEIIHILSSADNKIEAEEKRKASLQALFKTMLHLLMTGKVRVKELEATAS